MIIIIIIIQLFALQYQQYLYKFNFFIKKEKTIYLVERLYTNVQQQQHMVKKSEQTNKKELPPFIEVKGQ
jgi:hypothetical protein